MIMSKQKIPPLLKRAIWELYGKKSGYDDTPLTYNEIEIDHIIPERILLNPKPGEFEKWKKKYDLENGFNIQGIENLCPSTRQFNIEKSDKGFFDDAGAYDRCIRKALKRAKELKKEIQNKYEKYQKESDLRKLNPKIKTIEEIKRFIEDLKIEPTAFLKSLHIPINKKELTEVEEYNSYNLILDKYRDNGISFFNYGEYLEVKDCIRYSYDNNLGDTKFWIELIDVFIENIAESNLKKKLFYEKAFAMFKTGESWKPIEVELLEYFKSIRNEKNFEILEQIVNLWGVFYVELQRERVKSSKSTILDIKKQLLDIINSNINRAETPSRKTQLEFIKFFLKVAMKQNEDFKAWITRYIQELNEFNSQLKIPVYFNINKYYNNTVGGFSERLPIIETHPKFNKLFEDITELKNQYNGINSSIKDLMKRAIRTYENGNYFQAIEQFQKIKMKAFNPTKLYDCIFAYYYIGLCFERMDLFYASKYYYLTAFFLSNENDTSYETKQLAYRCGMDKLVAISSGLGHTKTAIYLTLYSLMLRTYYSVDIIDINNTENLDNRNLNLLFTLFIQGYLYEKKYGSEKSFTDTYNLLDKLGLLGLTERSLDTISEKERERIVDELRIINYRSMLNIKKCRTYSWNQFGVKWIVEWKNFAKNSFIIDEFISYVQIILFCIRNIDISFLYDEIPIRLSILEEIGYDGVKDGYHIVRITKNPKYKTYPPHLGRICSVLFQIISECAIVSDDQFRREIEVIFRDNYLSNSYQHLWVNSFGDDNFEQIK